MAATSIRRWSSPLVKVPQLNSKVDLARDVKYLWLTRGFALSKTFKSSGCIAFFRKTMKKLWIPIIALAIIVVIASAASPAFALYESKTSLLTKYKSLVAAHPSQASYVTIGYSPKGTVILMFRFGDPSSTGVVLWDAELHGNEDAGAVTAYLFCVWLFSGDSRATYILAHNYILIIPEVDNLNSRVNENHVNLNRNFPVGWGTSGSSSRTSSEYRGSSAGSEPETKALINVYKNYKPKFYINTHTWGGPVIYYSSLASSTITTLKSRLATYGKTYGGNPTSTNRWSRCSGGGFAITTANSYGIPSFLWEIGPSGSNPSYSDVIDKHYKETRCFLISICSICESSTVPPSAGPSTSLSVQVFDMDVAGELQLLVNGNLVYTNPGDATKDLVYTTLNFDITSYVDSGSNLVVFRNPTSTYCSVRNVQISVGGVTVVNDSTGTPLRGFTEKQYSFSIP